MVGIEIHKQDWWATPIWFFDIENDDIDFNKIESECYQEQNLDNIGRSVSNINGWQSQVIPFDKNDEIKKAIQVIASTHYAYTNAFGTKDNLEFSIDNYWINISNKGGYNAAHNHPQSLFSCVFYIKTPKDSGDIVFYKNYMEQFAINPYTKNDNAYNFETVKYPAIKKRVIVFPSYVLHSVEENKSDEDRISISFNYSIKNKNER
jgi:uncharacterized protein (TIGR02466 family)